MWRLQRSLQLLIVRLHRKQLIISLRTGSTDKEISPFQKLYARSRSERSYLVRTKNNGCVLAVAAAGLATHEQYLEVPDAGSLAQWHEPAQQKPACPRFKRNTGRARAPSPEFRNLPVRVRIAEQGEAEARVVRSARP